VEVSGRGEAEKSTGARERTRLAAVRPKRSFRDAIAAGAPSNEKMRERVVDRPSRPGRRWRRIRRHAAHLGWISKWTLGFGRKCLGCISNSRSPGGPSNKKKLEYSVLVACLEKNLYWWLVLGKPYLMP
jgi:hypothetical protein